jgi:hypothetical protein
VLAEIGALGQLSPAQDAKNYIRFCPKRPLLKDMEDG